MNRINPRAVGALAVVAALGGVCGPAAGPDYPGRSGTGQVV